MSELAIFGGTPVAPRRSVVWPKWNQETENALIQTYRSARLSVSWRSDGLGSQERSFAEAFARYNNARYAVCVDHGSSALVVALEALDVGPGDEVIVPNITWVATATAVLRVGAIPVLADVDAETGCLSSATIAECLSEKTRAVIVVHLASAIADVDDIASSISGKNIAIIEDCAQAHGAVLRGRKVGTLGDVGAFSFNQAKVLGCGEGGAVVVNDERLFIRAQQLRADGRVYEAIPIEAGAEELIERGEVTGGNYCMGELNAAILLQELDRLDQQHAQRETATRELESMLSGIGSFRPCPLPADDSAATRRSIYEWAIQFDTNEFGDAPLDRVAEAISAEMGMQIWAPDTKLSGWRLFRPETKRRFAKNWLENSPSNNGTNSAGVDWYRSHTLLMHHANFLESPEEIIPAIVDAFGKVKEASHELVMS